MITDFFHRLDPVLEELRIMGFTVLPGSIRYIAVVFKLGPGGHRFCGIL